VPVGKNIGFDVDFIADAALGWETAAVYVWLNSFNDDADAAFGLGSADGRLGHIDKDDLRGRLLQTA
jgi:hypothetical protein